METENVITVCLGNLELKRNDWKDRVPSLTWVKRRMDELVGKPVGEFIPKPEVPLTETQTLIARGRYSRGTNPEMSAGVLLSYYIHQCAEGFFVFGSVLPSAQLMESKAKGEVGSFKPNTLLVPVSAELKIFEINQLLGFNYKVK